LVQTKDYARADKDYAQ